MDRPYLLVHGNRKEAYLVQLKSNEDYGIYENTNHYLNIHFGSTKHLFGDTDQGRKQCEAFIDRYRAEGFAISEITDVRELEQAVRRILVTGQYKPDARPTPELGDDGLSQELASLQLTMSELAGHYCAALYSRYGSYEAVARHTHLDPRTVKKYLPQL